MLKAIARPITPVLRLSLVAAAITASSWSHAGLFDDNEARKAILELRDEIRNLQKDRNQLLDQATTMQGSLLNLQVQIDKLKEDHAKQLGRIEELESRTRSASSSAGTWGGEASSAGLIKLRLDGQDIQVGQQEKQLYDAALREFQNSDFASAEASFQALLGQYAESEYLPWVHYWLGNSQYAQKRYQDALANFRRVISSDSQNPKAPEAALAMANCYDALGRRPDAQRTLENLVRAFPHSEAALSAQEKLARR